MIDTATPNGEMVIVSAQVPTCDRDVLRRAAHDADRTLSAEIRRIIRQYVSDMSGPALARAN